MVERISIDGNNLLIELGELEVRVLSKALPVFGPLFAQFIYMMTRLVLIVASSGKDEVERFTERIEQGDNPVQILNEMGIDIKSLIDKSLEWPTGEEIERALGWFDEQ